MNWDTNEPLTWLEIGKVMISALITLAIAWFLLTGFLLIGE